MVGAVNKMGCEKGKIIKGLIEYIIAASFIMNVFANVISFYLTGNTDDQTRKMISHGIMAAFVLALIIYLLHKAFVSDSDTRRKMILCALPLMLNIVLCTIGVMRTAGRKDILNDLLSCGAYGFPLVCGAVYMMTENKLESVVHKVKYIMLLMMPYYMLAVKCYYSLTVGDNQADYGAIVYLSVGHSAVVIYSFLVWDLRLYFCQANMSKRCLGLVLGEMAICGVVVIMAGGRGPFFSWVGVNIIAVIMQLIYKERKVIMSILGIIVGVSVICAMAPSGNASLSRQSSLFYEVVRGDLKQSLSSDVSKEILSILYVQSNADDGMRGAFSKLKSEMGSSENSDILYAITNGSMARSYLWQLSIMEAKNKPTTGMGTLGFQIKYQTYPHNILLECLADFGILGFILFVGLCGVTAVVLFRMAFKENKYWCIIIWLSGEGCRAMISGNLYGFEPLMFAMALVIWHLGDNLENSKMLKPI